MVFKIIKQIINITLVILLYCILQFNIVYAEDYSKIPNGKYSGDVVWDNYSIDGCAPGNIAFVLVTDEYILTQIISGSGLSPVRHKFDKSSNEDQVVNWVGGYNFSFNFEIISRGRLKMNIFDGCTAEGILINQNLPKINVEPESIDNSPKEVIVKEGNNIDTIKQEITQVENDIMELKNLLVKLSEEEENLLDRKYIIIEQRQKEIKQKNTTDDKKKEIQKSIEEKIAAEKELIENEKEKLIEERKQLKLDAEKEIAEAKRILKKQSDEKIKKELEKNQIDKEKLEIAREELKIKKEELDLKSEVEADLIRNTQIWSNLTLKFFFDDIELFLSLHKEEIDMLKLLDLLKPVKIIKNKEIFNDEDLKDIKTLEFFLLENNNFKKINDQSIIKRKNNSKENIDIARSNLNNLLEFTYSYLVNNALEEGISGLTRVYNEYKDTSELKHYNEINKIISLIKNELNILGVNYK
jgi:hypothetical protein